MQYFLSETTYVGELKKRRLLVIDEAHNCDSELSNFIDITITEKFSNEFRTYISRKRTYE